MVKHEEDWQANYLPKGLNAKLASDFKGYRVDDIKKITDNGKVSYEIELKSSTQNWKAYYDNTGKLLRKVQD